MMSDRKHAYAFHVKHFSLRNIFWEYNEIFKFMRVGVISEEHR